MPQAPGSPLLAELHTHTCWSDGVLTVAELVDLHGRHGIDVLCISDHVVRGDDPCVPPEWCRGVTAETFPAYLEEIAREAERAVDRYGMLVLPGLELTYNDLDPAKAAHAVAVGLREFVPVDDGIAPAMHAAEAAGAALIAAHPSPAGEPAGNRRYPTSGFAAEPALRALAHRFELFNRGNAYPWVADEGLPVVAGGDFHRPEHLFSWKTRLLCERSEPGVVGYLRSPQPVYLSRLDPAPLRAAA